MQRDIQLLGTLSIVDDGETSVLLSSTKGCALLAYLIVRGRTETREHVADLLWDANSTAEGLRNLRVLLTRIRANLPDVTVSRKTLAFTPTAEEQVDYLTLAQALKVKDEALLLANLPLYQGDLLAGFYLEDAPRFQEWLTVERERLRRTVLNAHNWLCQKLAVEARWQQGAEVAAHWLAVDELEEVAVRWLMQFLAAAGQTAAALSEYERFRAHLQEQLNIDPEPETRQLAQTLRQAYSEAAGGLFAEMDFSVKLAWPARQTLAPVGLLPTTALVPFRRNPDFIGREQELVQVADLLLPWPDRVATAVPPVAIISGMGGMGKTQTAVEFCYRYGRYFPGGVFWMSFAEAANVSEEVAIVGGERGLGLFGSKERLTLAEQVGRVQRAWQEPIPRLLIFDNCETEGLLVKWLPVTGGCRVLVTSRRGVWSASLGITAVPLDLLPASQSVALLQNLIPHIQADEAKAIAAEVGHLPLALHLVSGFLNRYRQITPTTYLAQLQDENLLHHPSLQGRGTRYSPTGHELNVARTYALSFEQFDGTDPVDGMAQKLLAMMVCFAPGEPVDRALVQATVVPDEGDVTAVLLAEDGLNRLIALGLVTVEAGEQLVMHRLVAAFASTVLGEEQGAIEVVEETMVRLVTAVWEKELYLYDLPFAARQLRYVTDRALKRQDILSATLANYYGRHLMERMEYAQAEPYVRQALSMRQTLLGEHMDTAASLTNMGTLLWQWKSNTAARPYYEEAHQICKRLLGLDHPRTARSLNNLAILYSRQGRYDLAQVYFEETLAIYERTGAMDDAMVPHILGNMSLNFQRQGHFVQARTYLERALHLRAILDLENFQTAGNWFTLANLMILMGDYQAAQPALARSIALRKNLPDGEVTLAGLYIRLGELQMIAGYWTEAQNYLDQSLAILNRPSQKESINWGWLFVKQGQLHHLKGKFAEAEVLFQQALAYFKRKERPLHYFGNIDAFNQLADLYFQTGQSAAAKEVMDNALAICLEHHGEAHPFTAQVRLRLGEWHQGQGDEDKARSIFEEVEAVLKTAVAPTHIDFLRLQKCLAKA
jgi:DNA-binding SARP family transcriptional activator/Tfp pilus assembly protein PilF